jgi:hypothetical protein
MNTILYVISSIKQHIIRERSATLSSPKISPESINKASKEFYASLSNKIKWSLNGRYERGAAMARYSAVSFKTDPYQPEKKRLFQVRSSNQYRAPYDVDLDQTYCSCPDHAKGYFCKHIIASSIIENALKLEKVKQEIDAQLTKPPPQVILPAQMKEVDSEPPKPVVQKEVIPEVPKPDKQNEVSPVIPQPDQSKEHVIWGVIKLNGGYLGVELLDIQDDTVTVRALPKVIDGKKLLPQFPFEGKHMTATLAKEDVFHVKVFQ